jgi:large subunit ribosomal protein L17
MRKQVFGRKFKRDSDQRKALFRGLISSMILNGSLKTTEEKAKSVKPEIEKLVTKAKKANGNKSVLFGDVLKSNEVDKLINEIAPTFKERNGGYTRLVKTGRRFSDNASMALIEWVDQIVKPEPAPKAKKAAAPTQKEAPAKEVKKKPTVKKTAKK